jgi:hypothetical protein
MSSPYYGGGITDRTFTIEEVINAEEEYNRQADLNISCSRFLLLINPTPEHELPVAFAISIFDDAAEDNHPYATS